MSRSLIEARPACQLLRFDAEPILSLRAVDISFRVAIGDGRADVRREMVPFVDIAADAVRVLLHTWEEEYYAAATRPFHQALAHAALAQRMATRVDAPGGMGGIGEEVARIHQEICAVRTHPRTQRYAHRETPSFHVDDAGRLGEQVIRINTREDYLDQLRLSLRAEIDLVCRRYGIEDQANHLYEFLKQSPLHDSFEDPRDRDRERYERIRAVQSWTDELAGFDLQTVFRQEYVGAFAQRFSAPSEWQAAQDRGMKLLMENLTPEQRASYEASQHFDVQGCHTGRFYRIKHGSQQNVFELTKKGGKERVGYCFVPAGNLVPGDVMLAQKVALEVDENQALAVANKFPVWR